MKKYIIAIEETVVDNVEVIAESEEKALEIARTKYKNQEFILGPGECQYTQMAILQPYRGELEWTEI